MKPRSRIRRIATAAAALAAMLACGGSPTTPSSTDLQRALPVKVETAHYTFHYAERDAVDSNRQEIWHDWVVAQLGVTPGRKVEFYKYRDRAHMQQVTGKATNGWADPPAFAAHTIWPWDNHEVVHVLTALVGRPSDFFNEGIAVAMSTDPSTGRFVPAWQGQSVHYWPRQYRARRTLPALGSMVETEPFRKIDESTGYPVAGSFMSFLIDTRGMPAMRRFFTGDNRDERRTDIERRFADAFGATLASAEQDWLSFLDSGNDRP